MIEGENGLTVEEGYVKEDEIERERQKFREKKKRKRMSDERESGKKEIEEERKKKTAIQGGRREVKRKNAIEIKIKERFRE